MSDRFNEFPVGAKRSFTHVVTAEDVRRFVELTGDDNPVHVDPAYAASTPLGRPVAHGMLTGAFVSRLVGKHIPGDGALWVSQTFNFHHPVYTGDTLIIQAEVKQRSESQRALVIAVSVHKASGQLTLDGEGRVQLLAPQRPEPKAPETAPQRVALVTGASRGIGAACARQLARDGFAVSINFATDESGAESVVQGIRSAGGLAWTARGDVREAESSQRVIDEVRSRYGRLDVLVNNAGRPLRLIAAEQCAWSDLQENLDIYLKAAFVCSLAAWPHFKAQGGGAIINIGSIAADSRPPARFMPYSIAKEAVWALTKSLAAEWGPSGVRVNMVSPGMTETALIGEITPRARMLAKAETPSRRLAVPEDVAAAVSYLASPGASQVTGENIRVCGGAVML